jgi:hypothetical protein
MAKTKISEYSATAANNTDVESVNIAEGCAPSGINNAIREVMSHLKDFQVGSAGDDLTVGGNFSVTGTVTIPDNAISGDKVEGGTINAITINTLSANPTLSAGTANGVTYLNGSKVLTSGSALTFDGSTFAVNSAASIGSSTAKTKFYSDTTYNGIFNGASLGSNESIYMGGGTQFFFAGGSEAMRLTSTSLYTASNINVGIGTSSPSNPLTVQKANGGDFVALFQNTTSATPYGVFIKDAASSANGYPLFQVTNSAGSVAYLRVDSGTGNVGIGTGSPSEALEVYGTTPIIQINDRGLYQAQIGLIGNDLEIRGSSGSVEFYTGSADGASSTARLRIDSSGHLIAPNGITLGTAVGTYADANTLDDYEEGTWTPTIKGSSTNPSYTTSTASGSYVKIGKMVYVSFLVIVTGVSSQGTGNIILDELPFTMNDQSYAPSLTVMYNDAWDVDFRAMYASGVAWVMRPLGATQGNATWGGSSNLSTGYFSGSGCYLTDS